MTGKKVRQWDCFRALPLWRLSEAVAEVHSGMQSIQWGESGACLMAASVHLGARAESPSNSSEVTFHFPAPSLLVGDRVAPSIKPLLPLENEHSAGSDSEAAINNKLPDKRHCHRLWYKTEANPAECSRRWGRSWQLHRKKKKAIGRWQTQQELQFRIHTEPPGSWWKTDTGN